MVSHSSTKDNCPMYNGGSRCRGHPTDCGGIGLRPSPYPSPAFPSSNPPPAPPTSVHCLPLAPQPHPSFHAAQRTLGRLVICVPGSNSERCRTTGPRPSPTTPDPEPLVNLWLGGASSSSDPAVLQDLFRGMRPAVRCHSVVSFFGWRPHCALFLWVAVGDGGKFEGGTGEGAEGGGVT